MENKQVVLQAYVENQAILEPILFYLASKYKQANQNINKQKGWAIKTVCELPFYVPM